MTRKTIEVLHFRYVYYEQFDRIQLVFFDSVEGGMQIRIDEKSIGDIKLMPENLSIKEVGRGYKCSVSNNYYFFNDFHGQNPRLTEIIEDGKKRYELDGVFLHRFEFLNRQEILLWITIARGRITYWEALPYEVYLKNLERTEPDAYRKTLEERQSPKILKILDKKRAEDSEKFHKEFIEKYGSYENLSIQLLREKTWDQFIRENYHIHNFSFYNFSRYEILSPKARNCSLEFKLIQSENEFIHTYVDDKAEINYRNEYGIIDSHRLQLYSTINFDKLYPPFTEAIAVITEINSLKYVIAFFGWETNKFISENEYKIIQAKDKLLKTTSVYLNRISNIFKGRVDNMNVLTSLEKLEQLRKSGALNEDEYLLLKNRIIKN